MYLHTLNNSDIFEKYVVHEKETFTIYIFLIVFKEMFCVSFYGGYRCRCRYS